MSKHTPGPWTLRAGHPLDVEQVEHGQVAACETEDDARLIAAAPDLLAALQQLHHALAWHCREGAGPKGMDEKFLTEARAAIAKAEGTS